MANEPAILTEFERSFVSEYLKDADPKRAVVVSGYIGDQALKEGRVLLSKPHIAMEIARQYQVLVNRLSFSAEELHQRLIAEVDADVGDLFDDNGMFRPIAEWPLIWRQGLVTDVHVQESGNGDSRVLKIKFADRAKRLDMLAKHKSVGGYAAVKTESTVSGVDALFESLAPSLGPVSERSQEKSE